MSNKIMMRKLTPEQAQEKGIDGDTFIIPNKAHVDEAINELFGVSPFESSVEIWTTSKKSENWQCHQVPANFSKEKAKAFTDPRLREGFFINRIPSSLLRGLKEGDILEIFSGKFSIVTRLKQLGYRYQQYGPFQEVLITVAPETAFAAS